MDTLLQHFVQGLYQRLADYLRWPFLLSLQLYVIAVGYGIMNGWFSIAWRSMSIILYKMAAMIVMMTQWETVNHYLIHPIVSGTDQMGAVIADVMPLSSGQHSTLIHASQHMLSEITQVGMWLWHGGSLIHYSRLLAGLCVWLFGLGVTLYGFIHITMAHMVLYIMLGLTPFFVMFSLFYRFSQVTWHWVSVCLECVLLIVFLSSVMSLSVALTHQVFDHPYQQHASDFKLVDVVPVLVVSALSFSVMKLMLRWAAFVSSGLITAAKQYVFEKQARGECHE